MFCWHGSNALEFLEYKQTAMRYLDILIDQVHPPMLHCYPHKDGYFVENNSTTLCARSVQNRLDNHQSVLEVFKIG
ncbi:hypothetical protein TNCV_2922191 [Trichonephila clavipes]|nr:hypothetical protein TNCV_2922191 [Trichonephila clavipes]